MDDLGLAILICLLWGSGAVWGQGPALTISQQDVEMSLHSNATIELHARNIPSFMSPVLMFWPQHHDLIEVQPDRIMLKPGDSDYKLHLRSLGAGHSEITSNVTNRRITTNDIFLRITIYKEHWIDVFSLVVGWIYFVAWSVSFYPQIYINYKRKSVVGLNFDFQALNITGFVLYSIFNIGLYSIPEIKAEYSMRNPRGLNPVQVNDIVFAVHAAVACAFTVTQCFLYERGEQRVSWSARGLLASFTLVLLVVAILSATGTLHWLDWLYACSYVKLAITLIKYVPQAYMNYQRKSTIGWSIGNIFLDFTGGILSMLQMILLSYNYDDWDSIFGDPTKFGLGLFSVVFDIFFIIQHYVLYRDSDDETTSTDDLNKETTSSTDLKAPKNIV